MFSIGLFVLVFGATMAYVGWPLVHPLLSEDEPSVRERKRKALAEEKERLIGALRDLDHDHRTGKLDDADHATLTARLKSQAAAVLKDIDVNEGRRVMRPGDVAAAEPAPAPADAKLTPDSPTIRVTHSELKAAAAAAEAAVRFCTKCGRQAKADDDKFCGKCGATLPTD
jgi:hypothetical protein